MTFNIGNQQAGQITNVTGDQTVYGGITGNASFAGGADLASLRQVLDRLPLTVDQRSQLLTAVDDVEHALRGPDRQAAARPLRWLASRLKAWGALAAAGESVAGPLVRLAGLLGPVAVQGMQALLR